MRPRVQRFVLAAALTGLAAVAGDAGVATGADDPRFGLLGPLPASGAVPSIVHLRDAPRESDLTLRARARDYAGQIRRLRRAHFGPIRSPAVRASGLAELREFTDPAAFRPLIEELAGEGDEVRLALLDHFRGQGEEGQAALAWVAITDEDEAIRGEAGRRLAAPAATPVLRVLDQTLRSNRHEIANNAGAVAGMLGAIETIPLLIFSQATRDPAPQDEGDLAWIAIQTQRAFVANVRPVVGDNSGAFEPVLGVVSEGIVLRVTDAVVIVYRTVIHNALVAMTSRDWGRPTDDMGYDMRRWWEWYNEEYLPYKRDQHRLDPPAGGG
ncbi:MAG: hypothetical protein HKO59_08640 [Phycisphaerales bacterium]|nr:hypothetical protein [Phycisphaerales bacterium]